MKNTDFFYCISSSESPNFLWKSVNVYTDIAT